MVSKLVKCHDEMANFRVGRELTAHPRKLDCRNTSVGPYVSIGKNCTIQDSSVKNSLIQNQTTIKNATLDEAMIGNFVKYDGSFTKISIGDYSVLE